MVAVRRLALSIMVVAVASAGAMAADGPCLTLGFLAESPDFKAREQLAQAIYREAGLCASVQSVPARRIEAMIHDDELDGEVLRVDSYLRQMPELLAVPTPVATFTGRLYWPAGQPRPTGHGEVIGQPRGWKWPTQAAQSLHVDLAEYSQSIQLIKMVDSGRIAGFMMSDYDFEEFVAAGFDRARYTSEVVWREPMYHAVTRRHADLVPRLNAAIQRLAERGELSRLFSVPSSEPTK